MDIVIEDEVTLATWEREPQDHELDCNIVKLVSDKDQGRFFVVYSNNKYSSSGWKLSFSDIDYLKCGKFFLGLVADLEGDIAVEREIREGAGV